MPRRHAPGRRRRIIDAAIRVVGRDGIAGLSHRTVAAEADVPLGFTTYHFATLEELLVAALRQANENFGGVLAEVLPDDGRGDLAADLARALGQWRGGERTGVELEYELYPPRCAAPRPVAAEWTERAAALLARRTDPVMARALLALPDGICLQVLPTGGSYDEVRARALLARLIP
ncbi:TetR/AcrR family transcriptional regulator [Streptomyces sp. NPDC012751]|uniref:TetR/AcrR family transcriptional regulator n=1 Tax=Streptomyces sp. NPDC012751 TaxID=3364846 RepID=UPI00367D67ED